MFKKKNTLLQNIAFMSIMAAINLILTVFMTYVPFALPVVIIFLPMISVIVTIYCRKRYFPLYMVATIGLCLLATMNNMTDTLFFVVPAIISGFLFGLMILFKSPHAYLILIPSLINLSFVYLSIPFINLIYGFDYIEKLLITFKLNDFKYINEIVPSIIFLFSLIQALFSYMIMHGELPKFNIKMNNLNKYDPFTLILNFVLIILIGVFAPFYPVVSYTLTMILAFLSLTLFFENLKINGLYIAGGILAFLVSFFAIGLTYNSLSGLYAPLFINLAFLLINSIVFINKYLLMRHKNIKMNTDKLNND